MKKLLVIAAAAAAASVPAAAQERDDQRRPAARKACAGDERCTTPRYAYPWFYRGQDEGAQVRRPVRRLAVQF